MVADNFEDAHKTMTMGAKQYFFAARAVMEEILRPYDLGSMQWYVLGRLAESGPLDQRVVVKSSDVSRATLSDIISNMVTKGLISQSTNTGDERQKILELTSKGKQLWKKLPDPVETIMAIAFEGVANTDLDLIRQTLLRAASRLNNYKGSK